MFKTRYLKAAILAFAAAASTLLTSLPAQAIIVSGRWDPAYGAAFPDLGWRGVVNYDVPAACFSLNGPISGGTIAGCSFSGITLQSATVEFYKVSQSGNPTLSSLTWNAGNAGAITLATFGGGQLKGVVTSIFDPLPGPPTSGFNTVDDYSWVLDFQSGANGTSVARLGFGTVVCDDDSCSSRSTRLIRSFEAECEFRILGWNTEGNPTVKFGNPVPEPQTYILMLAGLTALGFVNRRRRQRSG